MTPSVTFPLLATKYPRAHRCRPQNSQSPEIRQQMVRCLALDGLHHSARRQTRRHAQQQMHMSAHVTAYNFDVVAALTVLPSLLTARNRPGDTGVILISIGSLTTGPLWTRSSATPGSTVIGMCRLI